MEEHKKEEKIEKVDEKVERRKNKIKSWLSNPYNLSIIGILIFAFAIRLYYFSLTKDQAVWWDEAEYLLKAKNIVFGTPDTGWWFGRPVLFSLVVALLFKIGIGEIGIRFLWVLLSTFNILLIYLIGEKLFNKRVGLIAGFLFSFFYLDLFYTMRLLVDMPQVFFILLASLFFIKGHLLQENKKYIWFIIPILVIGVLLRFTVGLFLILLLLFLFVTERFKFIKSKDWWISIAIGVLVYLPYGIWSFIKFKNPFYVITYVFGTAVGVGEFKEMRNPGDTPFNVFMQYINYLPNYTQYLLFFIFILGFIFILFELFIGFDLLLKKDKKQGKIFFVLLWVILPLIYFGFFVNHFEDRYIFMIFPTFFLVLALSIEKIHLFLSRYNKSIAISLVVVILAFGGFQMLKQSDSIIKTKISSYLPVKQAGIWILENTKPGDKIMSMSRPQNTYYSERETYTIPSNEADFMANFTLLKPKFIIISTWENYPKYAYSLDLAKYNLTPVKAYPNEVNPSLIIYKTPFN